jgi:hypothetical protein
MGNSPQTPVSSYDMADIGLRGCVSSKGWVNIANPGGSSIKVAQFSMTGSTSSKSSSSSSNSKDEEDQLEGLAEFKPALRALRAAMSFAPPWNRSVDAILGFMKQGNYCHAELGGNEKQARTLTRFTDYILEENSNRWRGKQAFVSTGEMKEAWSSFYSILPSQAASRKSQFPASQQQQPAAADWPETVEREHSSGEGSVLLRYFHEMEPGPLLHESRQLLYQSRETFEALLQLQACSQQPIDYMPERRCLGYLLQDTL